MSEFNDGTGEFDAPQGSGWEAVDRWLKASDSRKTVPMHEPIAQWGTRGFVAGLGAGVMIILADNVLHGLTGKEALAYPMAMGVCAALVSIPGMLLGLVIASARRWRNRQLPPTQ